MQSVASRIWTRVAVSISYDDNHYTTGTHHFIGALCDSLVDNNFQKLMNFYGYIFLCVEILQNRNSDRKYKYVIISIKASLQHGLSVDWNVTNGFFFLLKGQTP